MTIAHGLVIIGTVLWLTLYAYGVGQRATKKRR